MKRLQQLVERDQWSEILNDAQDLYEQSKHSEIEILAFKEKEAVQKATEIFNVLPSQLTFKQTKESSSSFLGFIKQPAHYLFSIKEEFRGDFKRKVNYNENNDLARNKDGSFQLLMRKKGLHLRVFEPTGLGRVITQNDILQELDKCHYSGINIELIKKAIQYPNKDIIIAPYITSGNDSTFSIVLEKDNMSARLFFSPPTEHGRIPELEEIITALRSSEVVYGINNLYIQEALDNELYDLSIIVAEGTPAVNGKDAYIEYTFPTGDELFKYAVRSDGSINFKELNIIHNVFQDSVLAIMHPATKGQDGQTVTGEILPATDGSSTEWSLGTNVYLSSDQTQVLASSPGQVYLKGKQICVDIALEIASDVDLTTGNIDFFGNVIIKGNITDGFSIISGGNIEVHGHIGKCFIHAEGDIIARQGIQGKDESQIECKGNLYAHFIERSQVNVDGNIIITKALLHSLVSCNKGVYVTGDSKKSIIAGGRVQALKEIVATQLGAESYIDTHLEVGYSKKLLTEIQTINTHIETQTKQIKEINAQMTYIAQEPSDKQKLQKIKLEQKERSLIKQKESNEIKLVASQKQLHTLRKNATISATKSFMPGVKIKIGQDTLDITMEQSAGTLLRVGEKISLEAFKPSEFTQELVKKNEQNTKKGKK